MRARSTFPAKSRPAFTMIELLVAMAISSVLMLALFSLVGQSTAAYSQTQRAVNTLSQSRAFIQFFEREISTRLPSASLIYENGNGSDDADKIAFVRAVSVDEENDANPGDLSTSYYYVNYSADSANAESPKLFRGILGARETQLLIESGGVAVFPATNPATDEPIILNVIGFHATPKFYTGSPAKPEDWDESSPQPPVLIELSISFVDEASAQRFRTRADWARLTTAPRENEKQLIRTFTRTISIAK